jgi:hypothetical protein
MPRINYKKLVRPDTFIGRYLEYCQHSETPVAYDIRTALWLLSVALGRGVVVDRPHAPVYLNLFCILVAESGVTRKSSAVRRAVKFARVLTDESNPLIESKITPEMLEWQLQEQTMEYGHAYNNIAIDELVTFLGKEKYVDKMPTLLTDLYDCPEVRTGGGTLSRGSTVLRNVFINFLSASTPSWLLRAVNPDVIEGGFTSRVVFIVAEQPKRSSPWPVASDDKLRDSIEDDLRRVRREASNIPSIHLTPTARSRFEAWYRRRELHRDTFRSSFQSREDAHVLRLAALLSVNDGAWQIQTNHIANAIKIVTECREDGARIFEGTGTHSKIILGLDALRDKLLVAGMNGSSQTELVAKVQRSMNAEHVKTALAVMHELGMVQKFEGIKLGPGRPKTVWRATRALADGKALDNIIERVS